MGIVNLPDVRSYWAKGLSEVLWVPSTMSGSCFEQMSRYLYLADNTKTPERDAKEYKLYELGNIQNKVNKHCKKSYIPQQEVSIDEQMIGRKACISFLQYTPKKPKKFGVKFWVLCKSLSGYCLQFEIYTGKTDNMVEHELSYQAVFDLMKPYVNKNHHLYFDNFYTSPKLVEDRISGIYSCGIIRTDKGQFPEDFKRTKLEIGSSLFLQAENMFAVHWKDKRDVFLFSLIHGNLSIEVQRKRGDMITKPSIVVEYNKFMGGVDSVTSFSVIICFVVNL